MTENDSPDTQNEPINAADAATAAAAPAPEDAMAKLRQEATAAQDRYLRAVADLENFRKRSVREKDELRQFAAGSVIEDLIPVLDNLGLGLVAARQQSDTKSVVEGVTMVLEQLKGAMARHGLKEIRPDKAPFDPNFHECISHQPSADVPEEHVMQVVRPGYTLNGRLLRPASVIVSSGPAKSGDAKS